MAHGGYGPPAYSYYNNIPPDVSEIHLAMDLKITYDFCPTYANDIQQYLAAKFKVPVLIKGKRSACCTSS